jgi:hypothetical protein
MFLAAASLVDGDRPQVSGRARIAMFRSTDEVMAPVLRSGGYESAEFPR